MRLPWQPKDEKIIIQDSETGEGEGIWAEPIDRNRNIYALKNVPITPGYSYGELVEVTEPGPEYHPVAIRKVAPEEVWSEEEIAKASNRAWWKLW